MKPGAFSCGASLDAAHFVGQGSFDTLRTAETSHHQRDMGAGYAKLPRHAGLNAVVEAGAPGLLCGMVGTRSNVCHMRKHDTKNLSLVKQKIEPNESARKIRDLREALGRLTQREFSEKVGVSFRQVQLWEQGRELPEGSEWIALGKLAGPPECWEFFEMAGLSKSDAYRLMPEVQAAVLDKIEEARVARFEIRPADKVDRRFRDSPNRFVGLPLLADRAAAGSPRVIREGQIDSYIPVPASLVPHPLDTVCMKVSGDSMEPILKDGYLVAVDTSQRDPRRLVQKMVAVREKAGEEAGVTIKWLDRSPGGYTLTPENKEVRPTIMTEDHEIVGQVIWWQGRQE